MKALIVIDYTNDFVADNGVLSCGEPGQAIDGRLAELMALFIDTEDYIVLAADKHEQDDRYHPERLLFPPHNLTGTSGRELYGEFGQFVNRLDQNQQSFYYWMDKTRYSAFAGTDLELKLRERGITELHLTGVCTDICVLHTAVDAYNKGFDIVVHKDAVASFDETGHEWALNHFANTLGAQVVEKWVAVK
ncbi:cysteine hydrolase family protein [Salisediminibacterium halotolerans]|uniref:Nicotinamidase-related amidase n=1 Tax=Salisediminibacterium halotolerans TaxID=517425 RepID=A0A1H9NYI4_9BACI|nr:isochorismatase family cysteine hydrolase [Salisediminibacterium haloalkalitolerans]SER40992.1 Nicotinamidase-related amidase [Salisediminibacterium haloalkalitolerans]